MARLAVTSHSFSKNQTLRAELEKYFSDPKYNDSGRVLAGSDLVNFLNGRELAIIGLEKITETVVLACPKLKAIAKYGVGLDNIDFDACEKRNIKVLYSKGVNAYSVAEHTVGLILALSRNIQSNSQKMKAGLWHKVGGTEIRGRRVGIIGVGHIGQEVARILNGFGARLLLNDLLDITEISKRYDAKVASKDEIFSSCEIVTLHLPLTEQTARLINAQALAIMKPTTVLINTSRGQVVDQSALKTALKSGKIRAAALDVFEEEPCKDMELLSLDNLLATPHTAGNSEEAVLAMGRAAINNLREIVHS